MLDLNLFFSVKPVTLNYFFTIWILKSESVGVSATYHFDEPTDQCFLVTVSSLVTVITKILFA